MEIRYAIKNEKYNVFSRYEYGWCASIGDATLFDTPEDALYEIRINMYQNCRVVKVELKVKDL